MGTLLFTVLSDAERLGVLKIPNPMANRRVLLPKLTKRKPAVLDAPKLQALFERARNTRLYPLVVLAAPLVAAAVSCLRSNGATRMKRGAKSMFRSRWNRQKVVFGSRPRNQRRRDVSLSPSGRSRSYARTGKCSSTIASCLERATTITI